jgi:carboxyl-terminal processing protease
LERSLEIIRLNSINRDSVDWEGLHSEVVKRTLDSRTYEDAAPIFSYIFKEIGDHHGALKLGKKNYSWDAGFHYQNRKVIDAVKKYDQVEVKLLDGNIAYILLPGNSDFSGKNIDHDTQTIRNAVATLDHKNIKGWILDLRLNTGGSMYQMLAGISDILGDGKLGSFVNQHGKNDGNWIIKNGNILLDTTKVSNLPGRVPSKHATKPMAVLISGMTASSGEVVAISTIGRKKSALIGELTAGYTTANEGFRVNNLAGLNLAVDYDADRNGKVYRDRIKPDIAIENGDNFEDLNSDLKIESAIRWIRRPHH